MWLVPLQPAMKGLLLQINSDTYLADVSLESSDDSADSGERDESDFPGFRLTRKKTLLERIQNPDLEPDVSVPPLTC